MSQYKLLQDKVKPFDSVLVNSVGDYLSSLEMPKSFLRCPDCNTHELSKMCGDICNPANYKCDRCNWRHVNHHHNPPPKPQNSPVPNNVNMNAVLSKAVRR